MSLSFPYTSFNFSSKPTCDPVLTEAISAHLSGEDGFTLQESVKREEDQCNYEAYQHSSTSSSSSSVKLSRLSSNDGMTDFYSLNANQDIDTSFTDFDLGREDELEGAVIVKDDTFSINHNLVIRGAKRYEEIVYSPRAVSTSEDYDDDDDAEEEEEDGFDSGISSLHLTPTDTNSLYSEKNLIFSPDLVQYKQEINDGPCSQMCFESQASQHRSTICNRPGRIRNRLTYSSSYFLERHDPYISEDRRQRVKRLSVSNRQHTNSETRFSTTTKHFDNKYKRYYNGEDNNSIVGLEQDDESVVYNGDEYLLSPFFAASSNPPLARIPQGYQMEAANDSSFYCNESINPHYSTGICMQTNQDHPVSRLTDEGYLENGQDPLDSNSSFYSASYSEPSSVYTNTSNIFAQKSTSSSFPSNTNCLSHRSFHKRNENRARKACLQNDFYYYSDSNNNSGCDSSSYPPSYQNVTVRDRGKLGIPSPVKQRVPRSILSSRLTHKSGVNITRNLFNDRDGSDSIQLQSRLFPTRNGGATGNGRRRHLLSFILELLTRRQSCVEWVNKTDQVFQIVNPDQLTRLWGEYKNNKRMTFESLSRSLRLYYAPGKLERIQGLRHHYRLLYPVLPSESDS